MARQANATPCLHSLAWAGRLVCCMPSRRDVLFVRPDAVPGREPEIGVLGGMSVRSRVCGENVGLREVGYRIRPGSRAGGRVAIGDPDSPEAHTHAPAQRLDYNSLLGSGSGTRNADCSR